MTSMIKESKDRAETIGERGVLHRRKRGNFTRRTKEGTRRGERGEVRDGRTGGRKERGNTTRMIKEINDRAEARGEREEEYLRGVKGGG